jgi:hypothetical protein
MSDVMGDAVPVRPRRTRIVWIAVVAVVVALAAGGGYALASGGRHKAAPAAATTVVVAPTTELPRLDERSACVLLIPALTDGATVMAALGAQPDGSTIDRAQLSSAIAKLTTLRDVAPTSMTSRIDEQLGPLRALQSIFETGANQTLELQTFKDSGTSLALQCRQYATG